jgi:hypothetical protein
LHDLAFKPNNTEGLTIDDLNWAATVIVDGEIGEENRMRLIRRIEIVKSWDEQNTLATALRPGTLSTLLPVKC